jgi:hypothetical protein
LYSPQTPSQPSPTPAPTHFSNSSLKTETNVSTNVRLLACLPCYPDKVFVYWDAEVAQVAFFPVADKSSRKNGKLYVRGHILPGLCPKIISTRTYSPANLSARQFVADNIRPSLTNNPAFVFYSALFVFNQQLMTNNSAFVFHSALSTQYLALLREIAALEWQNGTNAAQRR